MAVYVMVFLQYFEKIVWFLVFLPRLIFVGTSFLVESQKLCIFCHSAIQSCCSWSVKSSASGLRRYGTSICQWCFMIINQICTLVTIRMQLKTLEINLKKKICQTKIGTLRFFSTSSSNKQNYTD